MPVHAVYQSGKLIGWRWGKLANSTRRKKTQKNKNVRFLLLVGKKNANSDIIETHHARYMPRHASKLCAP